MYQRAARHRKRRRFFKNKTCVSKHCKKNSKLLYNAQNVLKICKKNISKQPYLPLFTKRTSQYRESRDYPSYRPSIVGRGDFNKIF